MKIKLIYILAVIILFIYGCSDDTTGPKGDVANPTFTPRAGEYDDTIIVEIKSETEEALIRYTLDGTDPTEESLLYEEPIEVASTLTITARAYKENWNPSIIAAARYVIRRTVAAPEFFPEAGEYNLPFQLKITTPTEDANIHYTTGNQTPHQGSPQYEEPISIDKTTTVRARAYRSGWRESIEVSADYTMVLPNLEFHPPPGVFHEYQNVSISFELPEDVRGSIADAKIYYTLDGSEPTVNSRLYTEPIRFERSYELKAIAVNEGWENSSIKRGFYELDLPQVVNPVFDPMPGTFFGEIEVSLETSIANADVYYTLDGTTPSIHSTPYTTPIEVLETTTIKSRAFKQDWYPSDVVSGTFVISESDINLVDVPSGTVNIGDTHGIGSFDERPVHEVNITGFLMGRYPVTNAEFLLVMGFEPSDFEGVDRPVENVSWYDAIEFCNRLSIMSSLTPVYSVYGSTNPDNWEKPFEPEVDWDADGYRLPTEAEWEYAARAAKKEPDFRYPGSNDLGTVAWYQGNTANRTLPVGRRQSNQLGLYDMAGNVWEWCWDWYSGSYYSVSPGDNPSGPAEGTVKVRRGGSWNSTAASCRTSNRSAVFPSVKSNRIGFRVVRKP